MRVIAGEARGRRLRTPRGRSTRPTTDRVKEALFAILAHHVPGARVLDLFAGSGQLGIEALSRGAASAIFVEQDPAAAQVIRQNLLTTGYAGHAEVHITSAARAVAVLARRGASFDLIFADPPYGRGMGRDILEKLAGARLVALDGVVALEHAVKEEIPTSAANVRRVRQARYGDSMLSFFRPGEASAGEGGDAP